MVEIGGVTQMKMGHDRKGEGVAHMEAVVATTV
jgi:hypothetical protein